MRVSDQIIQWIVRSSPSKRISNLVVSNHRKNVIPEWLWVNCSIAGHHYCLKVNTGEVQGYLCYMYGIWEPELTYFIQKLLVSKKCFFDIGSNLGYYTLLAAKINPQLSIYSFEPSPYTFEILNENIVANRITNVYPQRLALSDKTDTLKFNIYEDQALNSPHSEINDQHPFFKAGPMQVIDVPCTNLDDFMKNNVPQPDIIKIDVEGFEYFVLQGAKNLLGSSQPPILLCEIQPLWLKRFGIDPLNLIQYVEKFGYRILGLTPFGLVRKEELNLYPQCEDFIFAPINSIAELIEINNSFYSGWRKNKEKIKNAVRPFLGKRKRILYGQIDGNDKNG